MGIVIGLIVFFYGIAQYAAFQHAQDVIKTPRSKVAGHKLIMSVIVKNAQYVEKVRSFENEEHIAFGEGMGAPEIVVDLNYFNSIPKDKVYEYKNYAFVIQDGAVTKADLGITPDRIIKRTMILTSSRARRI